MSAGFNQSVGHLPTLEARRRGRRDLEMQLRGLLARCGDEFKARARRRRRWQIIRRVAGPRPYTCVFFSWHLGVFQYEVERRCTSTQFSRPHSE